MRQVQRGYCGRRAVVLKCMMIGVVVLLLAGCGNRSYKKGMEELENGNYKEAAAELQEAVKNDKEAADAYRGLGIALWEQEDYERAAGAFQSALDAGTEKTGTIYNFLGACELKLEHPEKALQYYEQGLKLEGSSKAVIREMEYNSIAACEQMKDWDSAKEKLSKYVEKYPDDEKAAKEAEFLETR